MGKQKKEYYIDLIGYATYKQFSNSPKEAVEDLMHILRPGVNFSVEVKRNNYSANGIVACVRQHGTLINRPRYYVVNEVLPYRPTRSGNLVQDIDNGVGPWQL